jgi:hypothetical protein
MYETPPPVLEFAAYRLTLLVAFSVGTLIELHHDAA